MDTYTIVVVLALAALSSLTTIIGVLLAIYVSRNPIWIAMGIGFSVGIMLLISFFELIPEAMAFETNTRVLMATASGALLIGIMDFIVPHTHLFKETTLISSRNIRAAYLAAFGLILHDFPEGFAMANAYLVTPAVGVTVALAIAIHNIPEEFAITVPAVATKNRKLLFRAAILSALAEPAGAAIGLFAGNLNPEFAPLMMAFAAGAMIYVSLHELTPMARSYGRLGYFATGIAISAVIYILMNAFLSE